MPGKWTAQQRVKFAKSIKKRREEKQNAANHSAEAEGQESPQFQSAVSYAFGHCQTWLDIYARGAGISEATLTFRVSELLQRTSRGQVVGVKHRVSGVQNGPAAGSGKRKS
jgi:hypothetical protein